MKFTKQNGVIITGIKERVMNKRELINKYIAVSLEVLKPILYVVIVFLLLNYEYDGPAIFNLTIIPMFLIPIYFGMKSKNEKIRFPLQAVITLVLSIALIGHKLFSKFWLVDYDMQRYIDFLKENILYIFCFSFLSVIVIETVVDLIMFFAKKKTHDEKNVSESSEHFGIKTVFTAILFSVISFLPIYVFSLLNVVRLDDWGDLIFGVFFFGFGFAFYIPLYRLLMNKSGNKIIYFCLTTLLAVLSGIITTTLCKSLDNRLSISASIGLVYLYYTTCGAVALVTITEIVRRTFEFVRPKIKLLLQNISYKKRNTENPTI